MITEAEKFVTNMCSGMTDAGKTVYHLSYEAVVLENYM